MAFRQVPGDRGAKLREIRLEVIERVGALAREVGANFILVAGDLFDANTVDDRTVAQGVSLLEEIGVPVYVLPGNHDCFAGPDSVYARDRFAGRGDSSIVVIAEPDALVIADGEAVLLPAPLRQRHVAEDPTSHITAELGVELASDAIRIGFAHGSVVDFSSEEDSRAPNLIDPRRAKMANLDYLALGDWHGLTCIDDRTWYSGSPEPTGFRDNDPGNVLVVEIEAHGATPSVTPHRVARGHWAKRDTELHDDDDIDALARWIDALESPRDSVVQIDLSGTLGLEQLSRLERMLDQAEGDLLHLRRGGDGVIPRARDEELDAIATAGFVKTTIDRLRETAALESEDASAAARALQILHRAHVSGESL
jgi:DNA repair exonuclease SbcCD nuclease subunit